MFSFCILFQDKNVAGKNDVGHSSFEGPGSADVSPENDSDDDVVDITSLMIRQPSFSGIGFQLPCGLLISSLMVLNLWLQIRMLFSSHIDSFVLFSLFTCLNCKI